jgi:hypothetical protein
VPFNGEQPHRDIGLCWRQTSTRSELLTDLARLLKQTMKQAMAAS